MTALGTHVDGLYVEEIKTLKAAGIRTTERLLERTKAAKGRRQLAEQTGIDRKRLLEWANACDHLRIKGIGKGYFLLLRASGVSTVRELQDRNPASLAQRMAETNRKKKLVHVLPSRKLVERWIEQAKKLPIVISY